MSESNNNPEKDQTGDDAKLNAAYEAEMRENYPIFKKIIYAWLREKYERELPPLPDEDLETYSLREGALPLEAFIDELERGPEGTGR